MRPMTLLLGLNAALLLSTSVMAADAIEPVEPLVIEDEEPMFSLSIDGGVTVFGLPDTDTIGTTNIGGLNDDDVLFDGLDDMLLGGGLRVQASAPLNDDGAALNVSAFGAFATREDSEDVVLNDERLLILHSPGLPGGTIHLDTWDLDGFPVGTGVGDDGDASADVAAAGGPSSTSGTLIGPTYDVDGGPNGFTYAGVIGDEQTFAFGAIATDQGMIFIGSGEMLGWEVSKDVKQDLIYAGGDITFSQSTTDDSEVTFTGYVGPSFRYLGTETTTEISVTPSQNVYFAPGFEYPTFAMETVENIDTYYGGAVIGGSVDVDLWTGATLSLGLGGGAYYASTSYDSETEATLTGGTDPVDESAVANFDLDPEEGFAYTLKADSTFSADIGENLQLKFGVGAEYMSRVATAQWVGEDGVTNEDTTGDEPFGDDVDYDRDDATGGTELAFGDAWSYKATIGLTGQF